MLIKKHSSVGVTFKVSQHGHIEYTSMFMTFKQDSTGVTGKLGSKA